MMPVLIVTALRDHAEQLDAYPGSTGHNSLRAFQVALPEIEAFMKLLITHVRDAAIEACDIALHPDANGPIAKRWRKVMQTRDPQSLASELIPDCVDNTLFYLLHAIDQGELRVSFTTSSGNTFDLAERGESEMAGWFMAPGGLRKMYSKQRVNDDWEDLS